MPVKPDVVFSGINFGYNTGFGHCLFRHCRRGYGGALIKRYPRHRLFLSQHDGSSDEDKYLVPVIIEEPSSSPIGRGEI